MPIEMTRNRLKNLAKHEGEITIEGEHQNEIVIRIPFGEYDEGKQETENAYNALFDIEDDRCQECGRYQAEGLKNGLCNDCLTKDYDRCQKCGIHAIGGICEDCQDAARVG